MTFMKLILSKSLTFQPISKEIVKIQNLLSKTSNFLLNYRATVKTPTYLILLCANVKVMIKYQLLLNLLNKFAKNHKLSI